MKPSILHRPRVSHRHPLFPIAPGGARFSSGDHALLILDERGCIQFCGDASLLGRDEDGLLGTPISRVIPSLALREREPDDNVAYVDFWFAGDIWRRHKGLTPEGQTHRLDITLRATISGGRQCFVGLIRQQHHPAQDSQPLRELFRPAQAETRLPWQKPRLH